MPIRELAARLERVRSGSIESQHKKLSEDLFDALGLIEKEIVKGRDKGWAKDDTGVSQHIPIYLTKFRVKNVESLFLKTRRKWKKGETHENFTDWGGLRVLVLFEACLSGCLPIIRMGEPTHRCRACHKWVTMHAPQVPGLN
ncbi:MAG: hypothetical protein HQL87_06955 [Magnetococcales bacterium]|nr:hypothetical protein [Magnetococcales bacterium]